MPRIVVIAGALALCFHLSATAADETWTNAERLNPGIVKQARYSEAKAAAAAGDHEKAYDLLCALAWDEPADPAVNYALGREAYVTKRYAHAATAFERVLAARPGLGFIHLELARAHAGAKLYLMAEAELGRALDAGPPDNVRGEIEELRKIVRTAARGWVCRGSVRASMFYNDNVNVGPSSSTIDIAPLSFGGISLTTLDVKDVSQPHDSMGLLGALTVDSAYDFGRRGGFSALGSLEYFTTWLDEEIVKDYELDFVRLTIGLQKPGPRRFWRLPVKFEHIDRNDHTLVDSAGAVPRFSCRSDSGNLWTTELDVEHREYRTQENLDGTYMRLGQKVKLPAGNRLDNVSLGVGLIGQDTRSHAFCNIGADLNAYAETTIPWDTTLYGAAKVSYAKYNERELLAPKRRTDLQSQAALGVKKQLSRRLGLDCSYKYSGNVSSFDLYEYNRNIIEMSVFCTF